MKKVLLILNSFLILFMFFIFAQVVRVRLFYEELGVGLSLNSDPHAFGLSLLQRILIASPIGLGILSIGIIASLYFLVKNYRTNNSQNLVRMIFVLFIGSMIYMTAVFMPIF